MCSGIEARALALGGREKSLYAHRLQHGTMRFLGVLMKKVLDKMHFALFRFIRRMVLLWSGTVLRCHVPYRIRRLIFGEALAMVNGFRMQLDLKHDTGISRDLFIFHKREHLSTDLLLTGNIIGAGDTTLDVGANIGYYALIESRLVGSSGHVYAVEPVSSNYRMLSKNIELNNINNIKTFRFAAGAENGTGDIHVAEKGNFSSFTYLEGERYSGTERVEVVRLDDFIAREGIEPALIRMDVEGFETEIIKGMPEALRKRPKLLIEVHPHLMDTARLQEMFETIAAAGYREAIVIKERKDVWMRSDGSVRPLLAFLSRKIDGSRQPLGMGDMQRMSLASLQETLAGRGSAFHALLS